MFGNFFSQNVPQAPEIVHLYVTLNISIYKVEGKEIQFTSNLHSCRLLSLQCFVHSLSGSCWCRQLADLPDQPPQCSLGRHLLPLHEARWSGLVQRLEGTAENKLKTFCLFDTYAAAVIEAVFSPAKEPAALLSCHAAMDLVVSKMVQIHGQH